MNRTDLEIAEGLIYQGENEAVTYTLTTTPYGSDPSGVSVTVEDLDNNEKDVTSSVTTGDPSEDGDVITLPEIHSLKRGHTYRVRVAFTTGGNDLTAKARIECIP